MIWKAKFVPQMWFRDNAVEVEALGADTWDISNADAAAALDAASDGYDWDYLRDSDSAPEWVKEYPGPFEVELISPSGESVTR